MKGLAVVATKKPSKRAASHDCMARIITALLVCEKLTRKAIKFKADVSTDRTVSRVLQALVQEGLVQVIKDIDSPHIRYYIWIGKK